MNDWIKETIDTILRWFGEQFAAVLESLNPWQLVARSLPLITPLLPPGLPYVVLYIIQLRLSIHYIGNVISLFGYFVHLPTLFFLLFMFVSMEAIILPVRIWRFLRSFIT